MQVIQNEVVNKLAQRGFVINQVDEADEESGQAAVCFMSKRISRSSTLYAEVDEDGSVNGQSLGAFLSATKR